MNTQKDLFGDAPPKVGSAFSNDAHALSKARGEAIHLGTSSWSFSGWKDLVYEREYSEKALAKHGLNAYAKHPLLNAVGIDRAHYKPLSVAEFENYRQCVPDNFRFLVKTHDHITLARFPAHARYGAFRLQKNDLFLNVNYAVNEVVGPTLEGLKEKLGVLLFQFAPQDVLEFGGALAFAKKLHDFLRGLPQLVSGMTYAVEVRNKELLSEDYRQALLDTRSSHCVNAISKMPSVREQIEFAKEAIGPMFVGRWMLKRGFSYSEAFERYAPFSKLVDEDLRTRKEFVHALLHAERTGRRALLIVNNKAEGCAPQSLREVAKEIARVRGFSFAR